MASQDVEKTNKRGDAKVTRAKILDIATQLFVERGYEDVGMREIAAKAGVTAAMINRYFGTKEALFVELIGDAFVFTELLDGPRAEFGKKIATMLLQPCGPFENRSEEEQHFKMLQIIFRSAATEGAPRQIQEILDKQIWQPIIAFLGGKHAHERAELIVSTAIGFVLMNKKVSSPSQKESRPEVLASLLATTIQNYVDAG
ncbi:MAG: TetR/AcrR family transcriptional regulator [Spongiibacteraceae bacterium]